MFAISANCSIQRCYLTLPGDEVALKELLHHNLLAVTGNLHADTQLSSFKENLCVCGCGCVSSSDLQPCLSSCRLPVPAGLDPCRERERGESGACHTDRETDRSDLHTGPVPVQRGDQPPGGALLLQQPANSRRLCALTCSEDNRLQQFHLETCVSESDDEVDPSR